MISEMKKIVNKVYPRTQRGVGGRPNHQRPKSSIPQLQQKHMKVFGSSESVKSKVERAQYPVFNRQWEIIKCLGSGNTSKVYLAQSLSDKNKLVALKFITQEFLGRHHDSYQAVEQEITILEKMNHGNIINILGWGADGTIVKPSGRVHDKLVYIMLEYVDGGLLFDLCQNLGGLGEDAGRFFLRQLLDVQEHMSS